MKHEYHNSHYSGTRRSDAKGLITAQILKRRNEQQTKAAEDRALRDKQREVDERASHSDSTKLLLEELGNMRGLRPPATANAICEIRPFGRRALDQRPWPTASLHRGIMAYRRHDRPPNSPRFAFPACLHHPPHSPQKLCTHQTFVHSESNSALDVFIRMKRHQLFDNELNKQLDI